MRQSGEHEGIVVLLFIELVLESYNLEALTTNLASMDGTFSAEVEHLLMGVRIIFNTWTHTDNDSPRWVWCEDEYWVVDGTKLRVYDWLHFMPLIELDGVVSDWCWEGCSSVTVCSISFGQLTLVVHAIGLHEALDMAPRLEELVLHLVNKGEVASLLDI